MTPVHFTAISGFHTLASVAGPLFAAAKKSSSSGFTLIFFVLLFAVGYMFLIRPQRQRRQRQMQATKQIEVGDKVMLTSGIIGRVQGFVGDHAMVEIAPGMVIEVVRQAVGQRIDEPVDGAGSDAAAYDPKAHSYGDQGHDDLVDDAGHDPYSVPPLEAGETGPTEDGDGQHPGAANGGGTR